MDHPLLKAENISKSFVGEERVVHNVDFEIKEEEIFALLGPSGCGKTTILRLISGFEELDQGQISLAGETLASREENRHLAPQKRGIGFVFQDYALFPHMSVIENVAFGLHELPKHKRHVFAEEVLCRTGMEQYQDRNPSELSGGQQQRVALARAIAPKPKLVLLDEPFSNLDANLRQSTRDEVREVLKKSRMSALLVTHDQEEALSFADRIAVMNNGRIEQIGTPEEVYYYPKTRFVAEFLGRTNIIEVNAANGGQVDTLFGSLQLNEEVEGSILCAIRPEHLTLENAAQKNGAPGQEGDECGLIVGREFKGHDITYHVKYHDTTYLVHTDNRMIFEQNDRVRIKPLEKAVVLEDKQKH